jgi:sugar phosphate isomerase/epimerase
MLQMYLAALCHGGLDPSVRTPDACASTCESDWTPAVFLSTLLTSLPLDFAPALRQARTLGFAHVDVVGLGERPPEHLDALADSGLLVACVAVGKGLPADQTLDADQTAPRRAALEAVKRQLADAARLGATHAYLVPGRDATPEGLARLAEVCVLLADFAGQRMVRLCVEHVPGTALPTADAALIWLEQTGHEDLALLLDVGHCLLSGEEPAGIVRRAGPRLGYVHLDDNDGQSDLHWPLLTGRLTRSALAAVLAALSAEGYTGGLSLELRATNPEPVEALAQGRALVESLLAELKT